MAYVGIYMLLENTTGHTGLLAHKGIDGVDVAVLVALEEELGEGEGLGEWGVVPVAYADVYPGSGKLLPLLRSATVAVDDPG